MTESHRACLVTWMFMVSKRQFQFHDETVFLGVNVLDRFLARTSVAADCFQLLGLASLLVAAKMVTCILISSCSPDLERHSWASKPGPRHSS